MVLQVDPEQMWKRNMIPTQVIELYSVTKPLLLVKYKTGQFHTQLTAASAPSETGSCMEGQEEKLHSLSATSDV